MTLYQLIILFDILTLVTSLLIACLKMLESLVSLSQKPLSFLSKNAVHLCPWICLGHFLVAGTKYLMPSWRCKVYFGSHLQRFQPVGSKVGQHDEGYGRADTAHGVETGEAERSRKRNSDKPIQATSPRGSPGLALPPNVTCPYKYSGGLIHR